MKLGRMKQNDSVTLDRSATINPLMEPIYRSYLARSSVSFVPIHIKELRMTTPNTTTDLFIRAQETGTSIETLIQRVVKDALRKQRDELTREFDAKLYDEREQMSIKLDMMRNEFRAEMEKLTATLTGLLMKAGKQTLPWRERMPPAESIIKIEAQLFRNKPKKGTNTHLLKVYLWDNSDRDPNAYKNGYWQAWMIPLKLASETSARESDIFNACLTDYATDPAARIGCVTHKGRKTNVKGTATVPDQLAIYNEDNHTLIVMIGEMCIELGCGEPQNSKTPNSAVRKWKQSV